MVICCYIFVGYFSHDSSASSSSNLLSTSPSPSDATKTLLVCESPYFVIYGNIVDCDDCELKFSLTDIAGCMGFHRHDVKNSRKYTLKCFSHYFKGVCQLNNTELSCDKEILNMKRLGGLETSTAEKIDIVVRQNDCFVLGIEVLSGPKMSAAVSRCIISATDTLRMLLLANKEVNGVTFFAVPSLSHPSCVVKVEVVWQRLQFHSTLTYYFEAQESVAAIKAEAIKQLKFRNLIPSNVDRPSLINLHDNDIKFLEIKDGVQQYSRRHIIIEDNDFIYKVLYKSTEIMAVYELLFWQYSFKRIINVVRYNPSNKAYKYLVYCYRKVKFRPLRLEEASQCLRPLLQSVRKAIEELHGYEFSHNDIRLPNICFNEDYEAVLIDIDSTRGIDTLHEYFINGAPSCMYNVKELQIETRNVTGKQTDYMQLGWMVTYILDPSADEHDRTFQSLKDDIKELKFVVNLIQKGSWDENLFQDFCLDSNTELRDIISE